ncbi:2-aminoethylphosphonate aminotransferase [Bacillus marasmi]|uniref:2-aminoethylphosphonate aminotransferase n=1 Tax=Bacillus marasmi TaxID=1926279 RepID=UPI0011CB3D78|nr:2-aminoethylphosphonate--pyruvate transaminase [Bacillus marasmi]
MISTAVILAAGLGSRIREHSGNHPKGFLLLDRLPIIEHSILTLLELGITKIYLGTGYKQEDYQALAEKYPQLHCVHNPNYEDSGSMYTLYQLKDVVKDDFLLLESDLIYEKKALTALIEHEHDNVILASRLTQSGDEVFIEVDESHHLLNMSKNSAHLHDIFGELVGITKLSYQGFQALTRIVEPRFKTNLQIDYEQGLIQLAKIEEVIVTKENDLVWCEVDDPHHWQRAKTVVFPLIKAREGTAQKIPVERKVLLNPGPATTTDTVKYAQIVPDICPREQDFGTVMEFISSELTKLVGNTEEFTTVLFAGSGTAAVEAILSSVIDDDEVLLIVNNGAYGKRMCQIAEIYQLNYLEFKSPPDQPINLEQLEAYIVAQKVKVSHLAIIHCETTTGLLNQLHEVGTLCKQHEITMIVDAMSSFAAVPIDMKAMNISYLAASSNKNLQGMAGVSFVIADKFALEKTKLNTPRNLYLNLYEQFRSFQETKQMRFTPPVQILYALKQAIIETNWEGIENRYARYSRSWETLISGITGLGLSHLVPVKNHSKIITSIIEPEHPQYNFNEMHDYFYKKGFTIYPGKLDQQNTFRVANIGNIDYRDIGRFIDLLAIYLHGLKGGDSNS